MGQVFKSGLSKFFKGCLWQNLLSPLLNTLFQMKLGKWNQIQEQLKSINM